eukprot:COSAG06_NODE_9973_length_1777_cov_6.084029_2_plen_116_part_01
MSDEATVSEHFVHAAQQQMDRCYALHVEGHSSLGEEYDQLLKTTLREAGVTVESPMEERDAIQNKLRKAWVASSYPGRASSERKAINPETIGQKRVAEDYYKTHVAKEARGELRDA